jgi:hypothetical protein
MVLAAGRSESHHGAGRRSLGPAGRKPLLCINKTNIEHVPIYLFLSIA